MYTKTSETTAYIKTDKHLFFLDSGEGGLPEHAQMMIDFEKKPSKVDEFINLLNKNPNTAFTIFVQNNYY